MRTFALIFSVLALSACTTETDVADSDTVDTGIETLEYNGQRAVLDGWMSSQGVVYTSGSGDEMVETWWTFSLESFDGLERTALIQPTGFNFTVEADGDGRFGTPVDQSRVSAGDIINYCWIAQVWPEGHIGTVGHSDIGGPELNSMSGGPYENHLVTSGGTLDLALRCELRGDAPLGTKIAVSMTYNVISDADVYDASVAREDNVGVLPQYYVQIGPDSCGNYELTDRYYDIPSTSCSLPFIELGTSALYWPASDPMVLFGSFGIRNGMGPGVVINEVYTHIYDLPEDMFYDENTRIEVNVGDQAGNASCLPISNLDGENSLACIVRGIDAMLYTNYPLDFTVRISDFPSVPNGHTMRAQVYYKWTDMTTGDGTTAIGGWPVIDSAMQLVTPY